MHVRLERKLTAIMRKHGYGKRSEAGKAGKASGTLLQGLSKGLYKWNRIVDAFVAERKMADGRIGYIPTVRFKGGHELGQPEEVPIFDLAEAENVLGYLLSTVKYIFPEMLKTQKPSEDTMEFRLFDVRFSVSKEAVEQIAEIARMSGMCPKEMAVEAQTALATICPMGMTLEMLESLSDDMSNTVNLLASTMIAGDRYVLDETDHYWRSLHGGDRSMH